MPSAQARPPLILNFDDSAGPIKGAFCLDLQAWQEKIRFACSWRDFEAVSADISRKLPPAYGTVLLGSGDYHHISYFLIKKLLEQWPQQLAGAAVSGGCAGAAAPGGGGQIHVVILDNHPDNMRYPFGIHCGSWVSHLALLPAVARIDVLGITSSDIALAHAWENRLLPLWRGKLRYWSIGVNTGWASLLGLSRAFRNFADAAAMTAAFTAEQAGRTMPVYLSLDKDALNPACVQTNWDQGVMTKDQLAALLTALQPRLIGADIVGEMSAYTYKSLFKRALSALDGQKPVPAAKLAASRQLNRDFNRQILPLLL